MRPIGGVTVHRLDNPVWEALTTFQEAFAEAYGPARRFVPEVSSLGALRSPDTEGFLALTRLVPGGVTLGLLIDEPSVTPSGFSIVESVPLLQMVHDETAVASPRCDSLELGVPDVSEMVALAELTRPGPFGPRTHELGTYLGIRRDGRLAAMAGERLRLPGYTEVSAVCTHPDFAGRGFAGALMALVLEKIHRRLDMPFLHVRPANLRAIELYRRLGFTVRRSLQYMVLRRTAV